MADGYTEGPHQPLDQLGPVPPDLLKLLLQQVGGQEANLDRGRPHSEIIQELEAVRGELKPLLDVVTTLDPENPRDFKLYNAYSHLVAEYVHGLNFFYTTRQIGSVLALAVLRHPADSTLQTLLAPEEGRGEAVFTHVDFQDPRHRILGTGGLYERAMETLRSISVGFSVPPLPPTEA